MPAKKLTGRLEARAREVTPRGIPYKVGDDWLPKGEWVDVTHAQAEEMDALGWPVTVREKETPKDAAANG
jgi:hypothetical protein